MLRLHRLRFGAALLLLILASLACGKSQLPPKPLSPGTQKGEIVLKEDFSDPESGWNQVTTEDGASEYADGMYRIWINQPNMDIWATPGREFTDARIEVDALKVGGERNNRFGLLCRVNGDNFYAFLISSDGFYGIGKAILGQFQLLGEKQRFQSNEAIQTGSQTNHLRADCTGSTLTLFVNGRKLAQVQDSDLPYGDVGLLAGTNTAPGVDIRFDNFIVTEFSE